MDPFGDFGPTLEVKGMGIMHIAVIGRLAALVTALALTSTLTSPAPPPSVAAPPAAPTVATAPVAYAGTVYLTFDD